MVNLITHLKNLKSNLQQKNNSQKLEKDFFFTLGLPYFGNSSHQFAEKLSILVKRKFNVDINVYYATSKTGSYFRLKCSTPLSLMSNVYKFNCSCDADISYIGMTTRHLCVRVREHLHSKVRSAVGKHIDNCHVCKEKPVGVNDFKIMRACSTEYNTQNSESFVHKEVQPKTELTVVCKWFFIFVECILTRFYLFIFFKYMCYVAY